MRKALSSIVLLTLAALPSLAAGQDNGRLLFTKVCATCHGERGEGRTMGGQPFPTIAGLPSWYVELQLKNFRTGVRGAHGRDTLGLLMRPIARSIPSDEAVRQVAAHIESLPRVHPPKAIEDIVVVKDGDPLIGTVEPKRGPAGELTIHVAGRGSVTVPASEIERTGRVNLDHGAMIYKSVCAACHGDQFQGNPAIKAPSHRPLGDWYMLRQLENFSEGVRGADAKDTGGAMMRPVAKDVMKTMAANLKVSQDEAEASVVAYIFATASKTADTATAQNKANP